LFSWVEYHHYSAVKIKPENKANIYSNNNNKLTPVKIGEKIINNKSLDLNYNCEIKKNSPVLIYSDSQKIITNDDNRHNEIYKINSSFLDESQNKNNIIKYKSYNNNYYLKNIQRYDKIDRPTINIGKNYINNCQIKDNRIDFGEK